MNMQRFLSIVKKEFIQIKRDKASFAIAIMMPLMMILLFGYAVVTQLEDISMLVLDQSNTAESRELIKSFENTSYFKVIGKAQNIDIIDDSINNGTAHSALIIPPDYADKIAKHEKPTVQFIVDGSDPTTARTAFSSGVMAAQSQSSKLIEKVTSKTLVTNNISGIDISTKVLFNPTLRNQNYTIPGLIGLIMQNITIILTAFALVREKERGTIEQLIVSPLKSPEIILGKLVPYIVIGFADFIYALILGIYWFNVPVAGSIPLLIFLGFGFVICALAIGILISTIAKTQLQAMQMAFLALLPSVLLSGFVFPREAMPKVIQYIGNVIPLTYFLNIIRGIVLKGLTINYLVQDVTLLFILGLVLLTLSIVRFRKKLD
ncbi:ABC transporter permease [Clostridium fungisolvens]|uniref:Putative multidrug ABC transporter permease YbhS n=1 Tax=Clostridium fungisolvens TaxID=1604897 RepID=A0A6V8SNH2_9CLOT|nr:ABC transporter permease [Clostridium fungisolvens]GFP78351.1 putative multidrug ABC transporter permease YbhS [Clostridium fungisolvens]